MTAGHISIVGPRRVMEDELAHYGDRRDEILALRPGLTGLWAVSGRSDIGTRSARSSSTDTSERGASDTTWRSFT
ncbi:MAG TPA: sugar transferase, partial [Actinomycetota bacterium]|nr:sugar transferase [Actinomycetota bacterium]